MALQRTALTQQQYVDLVAYVDRYRQAAAGTHGHGRVVIVILHIGNLNIVIIIVLVLPTKYVLFCSLAESSSILD